MTAMKSAYRFAALCLALPVLAASGAHATPRRAAIDCTVIVEFTSGREVLRDGRCDMRVSPASTFKLPLAVMGYDAGILKDARTPAWDYRPEFDAVKRDQRTVDPTIWEHDSVVWYSQEITRKLGQERFADYVAQFGYGNRDISGEKGKDNGLTHAWLGTSLTISPEEQVQFIRQLLAAKLPVAKAATLKTEAIIPRFEARDGWVIHGKTGSIWMRDGKDKFDKSRPIGWFVGWADKGERRIVFARLVVDQKPSAQPFGRKLRAEFIAALPEMMRRLGR